MSPKMRRMRFFAVPVCLVRVGAGAFALVAIGGISPLHLRRGEQRCLESRARARTVTRKARSTNAPLPEAGCRTVHRDYGNADSIPWSVAAQRQTLPEASGRGRI